MSEHASVRTQVQDRIATIVIDNPPLNILTPSVLVELRTAATDLKNGSGIWGVVVTGAGEKAFSAGADIKSFAAMKEEALRDYIKLGQETLTLIEELDQPVVAAVRGVALGGGNELALACDYRVAAYNSRFGQPEAVIGMIPGWGGTQRLPRLVGKAKAMELILTGRQIDASEALRIGLVNRVTAATQVIEDARSFIQSTTRMAPVAIALSKWAIRKGLESTSLAKGLEVEYEAVTKIAATKDLQEGIEAFLKKRPPAFQGK